MKVVIIGAVAAGAKVAAKTRRLMPDCEINIYTDDNYVSYSSCGLPYYIQGNFEDYRTLLVRSPEEFEQQNIHIHLRNKAIKIFPEINQVLIQNIDTKKFYTVDYDKLVISTGAKPLIPNNLDISADNVFTIRKIEDGIKIKELALKSQNATIIGSGYIGLEMLEAFTTLGLYTTVLELFNTIAPAFDEDISNVIYKQLMGISNNRFNIFTSQIVSEFVIENNLVKKIKTSSGLEIDTDLVVVCTGVKPNVELARSAGIAIGETGAIKVNKHMQTNYVNIYACGDCAEKTLLINDAKIWVPLGSTANKEGRIAALNICGFDDDFEGILASSVVRCLSFAMAKTGLTDKTAQKLGYNPISVLVNKNDKVGYMPDVNSILLKLTADKTTGLLLGGQAIGALSADKSINTLTSALLAHLSIKEFMNDDLTYAPPFSPTIDPLINAAQNLYEIYINKNQVIN